MKLRKLELKDAPLMLEWMHDDSVVHDLKANFAAKTLEDCKAFIQAAQDTTNNLHLAIVDDNDTYMGTVSLKHITEKNAELGITVRKTAMGKGYAIQAMQSIIEQGFTRYGLQVYWCVAPENERAVRFYDKNKYSRCTAPEEAKGAYSDEEMKHYIWYKGEKIADTD